MKEYGLGSKCCACFDVHHFPVLHLNVHLHGLCILMNSFDLRCEDVTYVNI